MSPLTRTGHPQPCAVQVDGAALQVAERREQAELTRGGPQTLLVLGSEIGGHGAPGPGPLACPTRASRHQGRRSVRMGATMVGRLISAGAAAAQPCSDWGPTLDRVLDLGADAGPSRLPLRP